MNGSRKKILINDVIVGSTIVKEKNDLQNFFQSRKNLIDKKSHSGSGQHLKKLLILIKKK